MGPATGKARPRSRVMAAAEANGIVAYEEGIVIHFDPPKNVDELHKIREIIQIKDSGLVGV